MNSRSAAGRNMKLQLMALTLHLRKKKESTATKNKEWLPMVCQLPKPDLSDWPPEQNIPSSVLYLLPKSSIHSYTWLFPQGRSWRMDKQQSLRPETSTYKLWTYKDSSSSESVPQRISQPVWDFLCKMLKKYFGRLAQQSAVHPCRAFTCQTKKLLLVLLKQEDFQSGNNCSKEVNQSSWSFSGTINKIKVRRKRKQHRKKLEELSIPILSYHEGILLFCHSFKLAVCRLWGLSQEILSKALPSNSFFCHWGCRSWFCFAHT